MKKSANESMKNKNKKHIGSALLFILFSWFFVFGLSVKWNWQEVKLTDQEKNQAIEDRKRLVELEMELITELARMEKEITGAVDYYNHLRNRKSCVEYKNRLYSEGQGYDMVSNVECGKPYKLELSFQ